MLKNFILKEKLKPRLFMGILENIDLTSLYLNALISVFVCRVGFFCLFFIIVSTFINLCI